MNVDLETASAAITITTAIGAAAAVVLQARLAKVFASQEDHDALGVRVAEVEKRFAMIPSHHDMQALSTRVGEVERGVAVIGATVGGIKEIVTRVERMTDLLVQGQMERERGGHD